MFTIDRSSSTTLGSAQRLDQFSQTSFPKLSFQPDAHRRPFLKPLTREEVLGNLDYVESMITAALESADEVYAQGMLKSCLNRAESIKTNLTLEIDSTRAQLESQKSTAVFIQGMLDDGSEGKDSQVTPANVEESNYLSQGFDAAARAQMRQHDADTEIRKIEAKNASAAVQAYQDRLQVLESLLREVDGRIQKCSAVAASRQAHP
ncbi:hypothetical protein SERLA73DRAFT_160164 [Serpula lacrymans var. lacrymans S7.3]|uniref:Uncharacterized protein n=2 Tax=Serpula lacrymans var. lacrymans TaxID=341189 RepID=F8PVP9_SERL3|nr:hypothetical protein SERLA73DRAFT_160164 [Serpula lacrymans var. lacrymans S7.3]